MKRFLSFTVCISLACLVFLSLCTSALASAYTLTGESAQTVKKIFEWSVWNAQGGKNDGKHIYIKVQPRCGRCATIVKDSAQIAKNVEIRWIFGNRQDPQAGYLHDEPMPTAFLDYIKGKREAETPLQNAKYAYNGSCSQLAQRAGLQFEMTPVAVFSTNDGIRVVESSNVKEILEELKKIVAVEDTGQQALPYIENLHTVALKAGAEHHNKTKTAQKMYMLPTEKSPYVDELEPNYLLKQSGKVKQDSSWIRGAYWGGDIWQPFIKVR